MQEYEVPVWAEAPEGPMVPEVPAAVVQAVVELVHVHE